MKQLLSTYSISGSVVTLTGVNRPRESVLSITNATTGAILYTAQTGGATAYTQETNSTITLATAPGASDRLQIFYDDGVNTTSDSGNLATLKDEAVAIKAKLPSLSSGRVPVEANNAESQVYDYTATGAVAANTVLIGPIECSQFREVSVQVSALGTSSTMRGEVSNNGTIWQDCPFVAYSGGSGSIGLGGISAIGQAQSFSISGFRYFRVRQNAAQTAGTTTLVAYASQQATPKLYQSVVVTGIPSFSMSASSVQSNGFVGFFSYVSTASTNATLVKTGNTAVGGVSLTNTSSSFKYVKFFNLGAAPTVGTSTPILNYGIPPASTIDLSMGVAGTRVSAGLSLAITGGARLLDNTPVAAGDVLVNITFI